MSPIADRPGHRWLGATLLGLGLLLGLVLAPAGVMASDGEWQARLRSLPTSLTYTFHSPQPRFVTDEEGLTTLEIEGFYPHGLPGDPQLPSGLKYIALPPLVPLENVTLEITSVEQQALAGEYEIAPVEPYLIAVEGYPVSTDWGPNATAIVNGRNTTIYGHDAYYPAAPVALERVSQMRKWRVALGRSGPVFYTPPSKMRRLTTLASVPPHNFTAADGRNAALELQDTLMDERAAELFTNFAEAQAWYAGLGGAPAQTETPPGYAIMTTAEIVRQSQALDDFVTHKRSLGFNVFLVTEHEYGDSPLQERPQKVRKWLQDHYRTDNILYVLLIGDPDPYDAADTDDDDREDIIGDMPMLMTWDDSLHLPDAYFGLRGVPTDHYFADLLGEWDLDGDGWYGEVNDHGDHGVDAWAEVYVGRIPVYRYERAGLDEDVPRVPNPNWPAALDDILRKTIDYETSPDQSWRRSALLGIAFFSKGSDSAAFGEYLKTAVLDPVDFDTYRMYWHGSECDSDYYSEEDLTDFGVLRRWAAHPYGVVTMIGHGWPGGISLGDNHCGDEVLGQRMIWSRRFLEEEDPPIPPLNDAQPAFVVQLSCATGTPEASYNLGYDLLKSGAIATLSASRVVFRGDDIPAPGASGSGSIGYHYLRNLVRPVSAGLALFAAKPEVSYNLFAYNLYGDPSVALLEGPPDAFPLANEENYELDVNQTLTVPAPGVLGNDFDPDREPITALLVKAPREGTLELRSDGGFTYTPPRDWLGWATFTYVASDGRLASEPAKTTIVVSDPCAAVFGNVIDNDCFSNGAEPWQLEAGGHGVYSVSTVNSFAGDYAAELRFDRGGLNSLFYQSGLVLQPDTVYELSFAAYSNAGQDMNVSVEQGAAPHENLGLSARPIDLGAEWAVYTTEFRTTRQRGVTNARLTFSFTPYVSAGSVYHLDRVIVQPAGEQRIYYLTEQAASLHVHEVAWWNDNYYGNRWRHWNIAAAAVAPPPLLDSPLVATTVQGEPRVYYLTAGPNGGHIVELAWFAAQWHSRDITADSGAPPVAGDNLATVTVGGEPQVYYVAWQGSNYHVMAALWSQDTNAWSTVDITAQVGKPPALNSALAAVEVNGQPRVYYLAKASSGGNVVHQLARSGNAWQALNLRVASGGALAASGSDLAAVVTTKGPRVYYLASGKAGQSVQELAWVSNRWRDTNLTRKLGLRPAISGSPLGALEIDDRPRVYFFGPEDKGDEVHVKELAWTGQRWGYTDLTDTDTMYCKPPSSESDLAVTKVGRWAHLYFQIENQQLFQYFQYHDADAQGYWDCYGVYIREDALPDPVTGGSLSAITFTNEQVYVVRP